MADDGPRSQTSFPSQIITELLEYLVLGGNRRQRRRCNHARLAQHRYQPLQRRPVARLDALLPCTVPEVAIDHAFIKVDQLQAVSIDPAEEIADQVQAPPRAVINELILDETRSVELDELSVGSTL